MSSFLKSLVATGVLAASAAFTAAVALPLAPATTNGTAAGNTLIQQIHGCHRDVERDRRGPHYHSRRDCRGISVRGERRGESRRDRRHRDYREDRRRRPVCTEKCKYSGPIKTCKRVCN